MTQYKPNETYVYEKANGITYARKIGDQPNQRFEIGRDYNGVSTLYKDLQEAKLWGEIHRAAKTNKTLQKALDRVKVLYRLSKDDPL